MKKRNLFLVITLMACGQKKPAPQEQTMPVENPYSPQITTNVQPIQTPAKFPYDIDEWVEQNLVYPEEAKHLRLDTTIHINFLINADSSVSYVGVTEIVHRAFYEEAQRLIALMPPWLPAQKNGVPVQCAYSIPVTFKMPVKPRRAITGEETSAEREMHQFQGQRLKTPSFNGNLNEWIARNLQYTPEMQREHLSGIIYVKFTVKADGTIADIRLARHSDPLMDSEAIRLVKSMPTWTPAFDNDIPVERPYIISIRFDAK